MTTAKPWPQDPLDKPQPSDAAKTVSGPLQTPPPIPDPGEADREKLLRDAETDGA